MKIRDYLRVLCVSVVKKGRKYLEHKIWDEMPEAWKKHRQRWENVPVKSTFRLNLGKSHKKISYFGGKAIVTLSPIVFFFRLDGLVVILPFCSNSKRAFL